MSQRQTTGVIKSYSTKSGYGFITDGSSGEDVFFGKEALPLEFQNGPGKCDNTEVCYDVGTNSKGKLQATNIRRLHAPQPGDLIHGIVKSWSAGKGFGFLTVSGLDGDIFFARDRLPDRLRDVDALENLTMIFELSQADDGKYQARNMQTPGFDEPRSLSTGPLSGGINKRVFREQADTPAKRMNLGLEGTRLMGTVKSYSTKSGYGFIVSEQNSSDVIVYDRDLGSMEINQGDLVEFELRYAPNGKPKAVNLQEVGPGNDVNVKRREPQQQTRARPTMDEYPTLTVHDLKLYADQLNAKDLGDLAAHATQALKRKMAGLC